jgi:hypothetical protein
MGDVGARPVRHHCGEVLGRLEAQVAMMLWMWRNSECKGRVREKKEADIRKSPEPALDARF